MIGRKEGLVYDFSSKEISVAVGKVKGYSMTCSDSTSFYIFSSRSIPEAKAYLLIKLSLIDFLILVSTSTYLPSH